MTTTRVLGLGGFFLGLMLFVEACGAPTPPTSSISDELKPQASKSSCGNGRCEASKNETCSTCPADCGACPAFCGDGVCNSPAEDCQTCAADCGCSANNGCNIYYGWFSGYRHACFACGPNDSCYGADDPTQTLGCDPCTQDCMCFDL